MKFIGRWLRKRKKVQKSNSFIEDKLSELPNYKGALKLLREKESDRYMGLLKQMRKESGVWRIPLDGKFWLLPKKQMKEVIEKDFTDKKEYYADKFDCENFTEMFVTHLAENYGVNAVGMVFDFSGAHAYNLIIYPKGLELFEPQNDEMFKVSKRNKKEYPLKTALILI